jgi:hypothetical protein
MATSDINGDIAIVIVEPSRNKNTQRRTICPIEWWLTSRRSTRKGIAMANPRTVRYFLPYLSESAPGTYVNRPVWSLMVMGERCIPARGPPSVGVRKAKRVAPPPSALNPKVSFV